jgi:hypothetical protein
MKSLSARPDLARIVGSLLLALPATSRAVELGFKVEPGLAVPLSGLQSQGFNPGVAVSLKAILGLGPCVDAAASLVFLGLPTMAGSLAPDSGRAWAGGVGVMLRLPRQSEGTSFLPEASFGARPWVDGDALLVRTGSRALPGFALGAGVFFPLGESRSFWLGPFIRYLQIVGNAIGGPENRDAVTLVIGLSLESGMSLPSQQAEL